MEFSVTHSLDRLTALYDALWAERYRRLEIALYFAAVAATVAILSWPESRLIAVAIASACVVMIAVAGSVRSSNRQRVRQLWQLLGTQALHYRIDDDAFSEISTIGNSSIRWQVFTPPREFKGYLLLQRLPADGAPLIALPLDQLGAAVRRALEDRIARASPAPMG